MSYGGAALQAAVYQHLLADAGVAATLGGAVYDALPGGARPETYAVLGAEKISARGDGGGRVARHDFEVSVVTGAAGFAAAKAGAAAVAEALEGAALDLGPGLALVGLRLRRAEARRAADGSERRVVLRFRATLDG